MPDFYCFNDLVHVLQPENSNWCWASCLEKMIKMFNSEYKIGPEDFQLMSYYVSLLNGTQNTNHCRAFDTSNGCDKPLKDEHVEHIFNQCGFTIFQDNDIINEFDKIVETLKTTQLPIILKTKYPDKSHMELILGYGERNGCKYVLISDPAKGSDISYTPLNKYLNQRDREIKKVWETGYIGGREVPNDNLKKDEILESNFNFFENLIKENIDYIDKNNIELLNPWSYIEAAFDTKVDNEINNKDIISILTSKIENNIPKRRCKNISRCSAPVGAINGRVYDRSNCNYKREKFLYLPNYLTYIELKTEKDQLLTKTISSPPSYNLKNDEWIPFHIFYENLKQQTKIPKIFFED